MECDAPKSDGSAKELLETRENGCLRLCLISPDGQRRDVMLRSGTVTIGRDSSCSLRVRDRKVSRRHAEIVFLDERWTILDCDSSNGTYLNGSLVQQAQRLRQGDVLRVGKTRILVMMLPPLNASLGSGRRSSRGPSLATIQEGDPTEPYQKWPNGAISRVPSQSIVPTPAESARKTS